MPRVTAEQLSLPLRWRDPAAFLAARLTRTVACPLLRAGLRDGECLARQLLRPGGGRENYEHCRQGCAAGLSALLAAGLVRRGPPCSCCAGRGYELRWSPGATAAWAEAHGGVAQLAADVRRGLAGRRT
jgi:hypothetical protein